MQKRFASALVAAFAALTLTSFADGESLAETGGYVPTDAPGLAFKDITLADLGTAYVPSAKMSGGWVTADGMPVSFCVRTVVDGAVRYQAQAVEGSVKAVAIEFTDGEGGVYVRAYDNRGFYNTDLTYFGKDIYNSSSTFPGAVATSADDGTYGIHDLALVPVSDLDAICINFNKDNATMLKTYEPVGPTAYAVTGFIWSQMLGTNNNTLNGVRLIDYETSATLDLPSVTVTITGTRGTYSWSGYNSDKDARYGYIDEDANNTTPTVTITNIPFDYYKVVFIPSTDTEDSKFGYITVNGKNYSSDNTGKSTDRDYDIVANSTDAWGKTRVSDYLHGVNYLVTPVHANNSGKTLTVTGHKSDGRGCIAAIQIVKAEAPDTIYSVTATGDVTWSTKDGLTVNSGTWASGNSIILVNNQANPVTVTFDEAVDASELILSGSGSTTIKFSESAYNQIAAFDFNGVTGEVVLDDYMQTVAFTLPATGVVRYKGTATLSSFPYNGSNSGFGLIIDQPITLADAGQLTLVGNKSLVAFDENCTATFTKFVIGNNGSANQTIEQRGGSIVVSGETLSANQSSLLFSHYSGAVVTLRSLGGTFTGNAAVRFGWDGQINWTIGDGESLDGTATVTVPGLQSGNGRSNNAVLTLKQGGTLNLGGFGFQSDSSASIYNFAGGILNFSADSQITNPGGITLVADTTTTLDTGANTVTNNAVVAGTGNLTKAGSGTLLFATSSSATGTLLVDEGTLMLGDGVVWAGTISVGANGTLDITDADASESETVYIPVGGTLALAEGATVKLNGAAINTEVWELSGGTFVNKTLKTAVTTATGDFAFSTATWESALGAGAEIDWSGSLSEVRVHANNSAPATATVDVNAANVSTFVVDGSGDMTFAASNGGGVSAGTYDFSAASGRVEYGLTTGSGTVVAGSDTVLTQNGNGTLDIAAGTKLTLAAPWGAVDGNTATYAGGFTPKDRSTLIIAPGEGMIQKTTQNVLWQYQLTTIAVSNGTLAVNVGGGGTGYFAGNSVRIDDGGVISLEVQDASGYNQTAAPITVNAGGTLAVKVRDTLRRPLVMNGGTVTVQGQESGRALDLYDNDTITVTANSTIQAIDDGTVQNPIIAFRKNTTVINIDDGISLVNNVTYGTSESGTVTIRGTMNHGNGNGSMVMNGFNGNPLVFTGLTTIGESGKPVMYVLNCEHQNGTYVVNAASRLKGTGSVTGNGGVTLAASNAKLCGALTVNNLTAASGGTYGDQWNSVAAKVATSYFAAGTQTIENGSFTIGADCVVTNSEGTADTTAAAFSIAANGNLKLDKSVTVAGLTVADGGTITLKASRSGVVDLDVNGTPTYSGTINIVLDFGAESAPGNFKVKLPKGLTSSNVNVSDAKGEKTWKVTNEGDDYYATSNGGFFIRLR